MKHNGFALLEVLISMTVLALVSLTVLGALSHLIRQQSFLRSANQQALAMQTQWVRDTVPGSAR